MSNCSRAEYFERRVFDRTTFLKFDKFMLSLILRAWVLLANKEQFYDQSCFLNKDEAAIRLQLEPYKAANYSALEQLEVPVWFAERKGAQRVNRPDLVAEFKQDSVTRASNSPASSKSVHIFVKKRAIKFATFGFFIWLSRREGFFAVEFKFGTWTQ